MAARGRKSNIGCKTAKIVTVPPFVLPMHILGDFGWIAAKPTETSMKVRLSVPKQQYIGQPGGVTQGAKHVAEHYFLWVGFPSP